MTATSQISSSDTATSCLYVTLSGLPLRIELQWPFHRSGSGADFSVLHGDVRLEGAQELHCLVAIQMTVTVKELLPSLEAKDVAAPVINTLRKEADRKQLEFLKSPKRVPVAFSARQYSFKRQEWAFGHATDQQIANLIKRKVYWQTKAGALQVHLADPTDAQYGSTTPSRLVEIAGTMGNWLRLNGEYAIATPELMAEGLNNPQIAHRLKISQSTVKFHIANLLAKLGVETRAEALVVAARNNLI